MWAIGDGVGLVGTEFVVMHEPAVVVTSSCLGYVDLLVKPLTLTLTLEYYSEVPQMVMNLRRKVALAQ